MLLQTSCCGATIHINCTRTGWLPISHQSVQLYFCRGNILPKLILGAALLAGGAFAFKTFQEKQNEKKDDDMAKSDGKKSLWGKNWSLMHSYYFFLVGNWHRRKYFLRKIRIWLSIVACLSSWIHLPLFFFLESATNKVCHLVQLHDSHLLYCTDVVIIYLLPKFQGL